MTKFHEPKAIPTKESLPTHRTLIKTTVYIKDKKGIKKWKPVKESIVRIDNTRRRNKDIQRETMRRLLDIEWEQEPLK